MVDRPIVDRACRAPSAAVLGLVDLGGEVVRAELGVLELGGERQLEMQVGADTDVDGAGEQGEIEHVAAVPMRGVDVVNMAAWHADALDAAGKPTHRVAVVNAVESTFSTAYQGASLSYAFTR